MAIGQIGKLVHMVLHSRVLLGYHPACCRKSRQKENGLLAGRGAFHSKVAVAGACGFIPL